MWNLTIIMELAIGGISIYLLSRELEFGFIGALSAALLFIFCPWVQWQAELLGNGICLIPFVFLFFVKAAKNNSLFYTVIAGIAAAIDVLAAHPEMSFITMFFAIVLMYLVHYTQNNPGVNFLTIWGRTTLAGSIAFGLSAPLLLPFAEYVSNGYTYKLGTVAPANITGEALITNYFYPFHTEGNLFWGPCSWLGLIALIIVGIKYNRFVVCIFTCLVLAIFSVTKLFPASLLFQTFPFSIVESIYCLPEYIVFISMLSGLGVECLTSRIGSMSRRKSAILFVCLLISSLVSLIFVFYHPIDSHIRTDQTSGVALFNWKFWLTNVAFVIVMLIALNMLRSPLARLKQLGYSILVISISCSLLFTAKDSLPIRPSFDYPKSLPLKITANDDSRFLTTGIHLLRHNTNLLYGVNDLQAYGPLLPKRFVEFMKICNANTSDHFSQIFSPAISRNINITATDTIISEQPLLDETILTKQLSKKNEQEKSLETKVVYSNLLNLNHIQFFFNRKEGAIFCSLVANPVISASEDYCLYMNIRDANNKSYALGDPQFITGCSSDQPLIFSGFLPKNQLNWTLSASLLSARDGHTIAATSTTLGKISSDGFWMPISSNELALLTEITNSRFTLLSQYKSILAYKDTSALSKYFFVSNVKWLKYDTAVFEYIKRNSESLSNEVVLEDSQRKLFETVVQKLQPMKSTVFDTTGKIRKIDVANLVNYFTTASAFKLETKVTSPALLVVSDLYYPGWKVFLDNKDWPMFRANYLFRAVLVPSGKHHITFEYHPLSFLIGLGFTVSTIIGILFFLIQYFYRARIAAS